MASWRVIACSSVSKTRSGRMGSGSYPRGWSAHIPGGRPSAKRQRLRGGPDDLLQTIAGLLNLPGGAKGKA